MSEYPYRRVMKDRKELHPGHSQISSLSSRSHWLLKGSGETKHPPPLFWVILFTIHDSEQWGIYPAGSPLPPYLYYPSPPQPHNDGPSGQTGIYPHDTEPFDFALTVAKPAGWPWSTPKEIFGNNTLWTGVRAGDILVGLVMRAKKKNRAGSGHILHPRSRKKRQTISGTWSSPVSGRTRT